MLYGTHFHDLGNNYEVWSRQESVTDKPMDVGTDRQSQANI